MKLNPKDFESYKNDGVIRINNVFSLKKYHFLNKKINHYIKKNRSKLKGKEINL